MTNQPPILPRTAGIEPPRLPARARNGQRPVAARPAPSGSKFSWWMDNKLAVLGMLFLVTAALGLPFLWRSRGFSRNEKIVWSVIVSIYTALVLWGFAAVMWWSYSRISESLS